MTESLAGASPKVVCMHVPSRDLTPDDMELTDFARQIVAANTDGEDGVHTMGAAVRGVDGYTWPAGARGGTSRQAASRSQPEGAAVYNRLRSTAGRDF